jgi:hypothetical protein
MDAFGGFFLAQGKRINSIINHLIIWVGLLDNVSHLPPTYYFTVVGDVDSLAILPINEAALHHS